MDSLVFLERHPYCVNRWENINGYIGFDFDKSIDGSDYHIVIAVPSNTRQLPVFWQCLKLNSLRLLPFDQTPDWFRELVQRAQTVHTSL